MDPVNQKNEHPTWIKSPSRNSTSNAQLDELLSDRDDTILSEPEMQLGMILRRKGCETSRKVSGDSKSQVMIDQSKLILYEDSLTVMQKRNVALIAENESLSNQLKKIAERVRELRNKNSSLERRLQEGDVQNRRKIVENRGTSTIDCLERTERGVQAWAVCRSCERKFEDQKSEATAIITKSELDRLEKDMQRLRDAVANRESDWDRAIEREHCYREQLKCLATESITSRQLSDSRHAEIERLTQILADTERDLRSAQKEISGLKRMIAKQEKRQRELEANSSDNVNGSQTSPDINEKELKWIDDIARQLSSAKNKQKSRLIKDKAIYTSGTNSKTNQSSPRARSTGESIEEPSTVVEILSKS